MPGGARYRALVTGRAPLDLDVRTVVARDSAEGEKRLLPLTLVILVLAFGALVAATLPLIVGVLAITVSLAIIGVIAHYTPMSVFVLNMTTMIGLGVGIDYSLLIVTRFREELARGVTAAGRRGQHAGDRGPGGHHVGTHRVVGLRRPAADAADRDPERRHRRAHRGGRGGAALDHPAPRPARRARPRDRPAALAGAPAHLVPRAAGVGEVGPHAEPAPDPGPGLRRRRHRAAHPAGVLHQDRTAVAPLVAGRHRGRRWAAGALGDGRGRVHPAGAGAGAGARGAKRRRGDLAPRAHDAGRLAQGRPAGARGAQRGERGAQGQPAGLFGALQRSARGSRQVPRLPRCVPEQRPAARPDGRDPGRHDLAHHGHGRRDSRAPARQGAAPGHQGDDASPSAATRQRRSTSRRTCWRGSRCS